jgi:DNA anti-recombination protein RmuC
MQRQMEALLIRTNEVLQAMQAAQGAVAESSAQSADSVRHAAAAAIEQTKSATSELDEQARRVEGSLERILNDLEKALQSTGTVVQEFSAQALSARDLSKTTYDAAQKFASGSVTIQQASLKFDENLRSLGELINRQQSSQSEFARVIPASIGEVQKRLSEQTRELSAAWKELQGALSKSVETIAGQLTEPIENLGDHVGNLQRALTSAGDRR